MTSNLERKFDGQIGVITGGCSGIGLGVVTRLASEGLKTVVFDINGDEAKAQLSLLATKGYEVEFVKVDVSDEESVSQGFNYVSAKYGRLDVMVNSAGIVGPSDTLASDVSVEDFDKVHKVNLRGTFLITKYALKMMLKHNYGRILLIASTAGKEGNVRVSAYSSSKAAVIGFAKATGKEYEETNITINALAPAFIATALATSCDPEYVKRHVEKIPMKRMGTVEEVAALVSYAVSPEAGFITANCFDISGGRATY